MLTETLQRLERLDGMDSTLFGRELLSFGRLLLDRGWIAAIGYFSHIDVEVMDDIFEEVEVTVDEAAGLYTYPHPFRRKVILSGSLAEVDSTKPRLLAVFFAICTVGIIVVGYLFNVFHAMMIL